MAAEGCGTVTGEGGGALEEAGADRGRGLQQRSVEGQQQPHPAAAPAARPRLQAPRNHTGEARTTPSQALENLIVDRHEHISAAFIVY